ncbi:MAG: DUF4197 domain-containing protein [Rhodospirillales bacterium]|nr:DUF4197 domain-containing protein [Rhodospirillales bacterium]
MLGLARAGYGLLAMLGSLLLATGDGALAQGSLFDKAKETLGDYGISVPGADALGSDDIAAGLREALKVGSERVVRQVGAPDGFNADPEIHIPLPGALEDVQSMLRKVGMAGLADDLELKLNRGAEAAAPEAKALFLRAISEMTLDDAEKIYKGPDDAATQYFKDKMSPPLAERMTPVVDKSLSEVGAVRSYDEMMGRYEAIPFVPDVKADLTAYVVGKALDGIFFYIAKEEAAIRSDPAARTTDLLKKVFGAG